PMNRKMSGFANGAAAASTGATPSAGKSTSGMSAVTASGRASVIQRMAISTATAATRQAAGESPSGAGDASTAAAARTATMSAIARRRATRPVTTDGFKAAGILVFFGPAANASKDSRPRTTHRAPP